MKKTFILIFLICLALALLPTPQAQAMDPVTIALLAPVAIKAAKIASPYIIKGLIGGFKHMLLMGKDMIEMMRLPLGFTQILFLAPFGQLKSGIKNMLLGSIAPLKFGFHALLFPVALAGVQVN